VILDLRLLRIRDFITRAGLCALSIMVTSVLTISARAQNEFVSALAGGAPLIDLRLRFEDIAQSNKPRRAYAATLRARLGYETGQFHGFSALAEADLIGHAWGEHFNNTLNGQTAFPVIADPDIAALNRLQLDYAAALTDDAAANRPDLHVHVGRQRIIFGDARFIGNAPWRQHEQTYDAVMIVDTSLPSTTLSYAYVNQVNRVFGPNSPMGRFNGDTNLFNAVYSGLAPVLNIEAYDYLLDFRQAPALSTATYGARGEIRLNLLPDMTAQLNAAYARQSNYGPNPAHFDLGYYLGEAGLAYGGMSETLGYEVLEGNGAIGFSTPLASLHGFQGWAELFVTDPPNGIRDFYVRTRYTFSAPLISSTIAATVIHHDFNAEHVQAAYGKEWDASLEAALPQGFMLGTAYADFKGNRGAFPDKAVFWFYSGYRY
jgi:hypothetical protein